MESMEADMGKPLNCQNFQDCAGGLRIGAKRAAKINAKQSIKIAGLPCKMQPSDNRFVF